LKTWFPGSRSSPYKSAASATTNINSHKYESFSLNCPHVADASNDKVRIEVTWTLNDTIWLKIEDGQKKIFNHLTTSNKRVVSGKTVLRVLLNNGRYFFDYDELTGDFSMEIRPVHENDAGVWQCHVTVYQQGNTHTLTSRNRVKVPHKVGSFRFLINKGKENLKTQKKIFETF
uniref:Ig-like domain-containing protein n=1 Tax=Angiostrongylus costaricensis TaxID=334426 RepID=A0A0R3PTY4_ANGCS